MGRRSGLSGAHRTPVEDRRGALVLRRPVDVGRRRRWGWAWLTWPRREPPAAPPEERRGQLVQVVGRRGRAGRGWVFFPRGKTVEPRRPKLLQVRPALRRSASATPVRGSSHLWRVPRLAAVFGPVCTFLARLRELVTGSVARPIVVDAEVRGLTSGVGARSLVVSARSRVLTVVAVECC